MKAAVDRMAQRYPHLFVTAMIVIHGEGDDVSGTSADHRLSLETARSLVDWGAWVNVHSQTSYRPGLARQLAAQLKGWQGDGAGPEPTMMKPRARRAASRSARATSAPFGSLSSFSGGAPSTPSAPSARRKRRHPPRTPGPRDWSPPRRGR